jgi:hypothetical protein
MITMEGPLFLASSDRPYPLVRRPREGNVGDQNTMSQNAAQSGVEPDGRCYGCTAAARHLVESAIGRVRCSIHCRIGVVCNATVSQRSFCFTYSLVNR